jgi:hypothetical protein
MRNGNPVDLIGGILVALVGLFFLFYALAHYRLGAPQNMGPGYVPASFGTVTAVVGFVIIAMSFRVPGSFSEIAWLPAFWIFVSIIGFIAGMIWFGMLPAVALTVVFSSLADKESRPRETIFLIIAACVGTWLIFSVGLGLTAPLLRMPF